MLCPRPHLRDLFLRLAIALDDLAPDALYLVCLPPNPGRDLAPATVAPPPLLPCPVPALLPRASPIQTLRNPEDSTLTPIPTTALT